VDGAHPVLPAPAVAAGPARHDLLGDDAVAHLDAPVRASLFVQLDDGADELVARDDLRLGPGRTLAVTPELRCTVVALQVAGADADGLDAHEELARPRDGDRHGLEPVVLRTVTDDRPHRRRTVCRRPPVG